MSIPAWKLEKFRLVERYREINRECEKGQVLFAGSSLMEMFPVEEWAAELGPDAPKVYNRGVGGFRTEDMLPRLDALVTDLMPRRLFINIGTNDLSDASVTIDALIERYEEILRRIEEAVPGIDVILMAYYPINYEAADEGMKACLRIRTNERIREANAAVAAMARRCGYRYRDFNAPLTDAQGRLKAEYTIEGMHIKPEGYRAIWPAVKQAILAPYITFEDYHAITDDGIQSISQKGIVLGNGDFIDFAACAANFSALNGGTGTCVGERDITGTNPAFAFYTAPKTTHVFFLPKGLLGRQDALRRFHDMQKTLLSLGYTTYDIS